VLNLILFLLFSFASLFTNGSFAFDFAFINLCTALSNLLPIRGYDGYRLLETAILMKSDKEYRALNILSRFSFIFTSALCFLSLYLLLKLGEGYWIFALFFTSVMLDVKKLTETNVFRE